MPVIVHNTRYYKYTKDLNVISDCALSFQYSVFHCGHLALAVWQNAKSNQRF
jgi:hypothetical protein